MKFIAKLPDAKHYKQIENSKWIDKQSSLLIVKSDIGNPFGKVCCIVLSPQKGKTNEAVVHSKLVLKILSFETIATHQLIRSIEIGRYIYTPKDTLWFAAFPSEYNEQWYKYLVYLFRNI